MNTVTNPFAGIGGIVAVGSTDGVLATAAAMRLIGKIVPVQWTQAFDVLKVDLTVFAPGTRLLLIDLAVNHTNEAMTAEFLRKIEEAGLVIAGICDEHDHEAWSRVYGPFDALIVAPESRSEGVYTSSGKILLDRFGHLMDSHARELCEDADLADDMKRPTFVRFGAIANNSVKPAIGDNSRRTAVTECLAFSGEPNEVVCGYLAEYAAIEANNLILANEHTVISAGVARVRNPDGLRIDATSLMGLLYDRKYRLVILNDVVFSKEHGGKVPVVSFGTSDKSLNLQQILRDAGVPVVSGFPAKMSVLAENETVALIAISAKM